MLCTLSLLSFFCPFFPGTEITRRSKKNKASTSWYLVHQLWKMLWKIKVFPRSLNLLGETHTPHFHSEYPPQTFVRALGSRLLPPVSASPRNPWLLSFLMLLNSLVGKQSSYMKLGLWYKPNPGKWAEVSRFHSHGLFPDLQLMLHKREISVTQFADRLPRGHDLSVFLVPSSADVLDPVWNAHARNPGKQQLFHKSSSDLVVRWEPSVRRHHPSQSHPSYLP